jgi:hypothetical protein
MLDCHASTASSVRGVPSSTSRDGTVYNRSLGPIDHPDGRVPSNTRIGAVSPEDSIELGHFAPTAGGEIVRCPLPYWMARNRGSMSLLAEQLVHPRDLGPQLAGVAGPDVGLEHQRHAR